MSFSHTCKYRRKELDKNIVKILNKVKGDGEIKIYNCSVYD